MMSDVAHTAMSSYFWSIAAILLIGLYSAVSCYLTIKHIIGGSPVGLRARLQQRARLCLDQTGFISAVITRHTLLVTMNVLMLNFSLNLLSALRALNDQSVVALRLILGFELLAGGCIALIIIIAMVIFILCSNIVKLAEDKQ